MTEHRSKTTMLLLIYIATFIYALGQGVILPILPLFFRGLGISFFFLGVLSALPSVTRLLAQTPLGNISDKIGRKNLIIIGFLVTASIAPMYPFLNDPNLVFFLRGVEGVAAALCAGTLTIALLSEITIAGVQGRIMGNYQGFNFLGMALGPLIGGYIAEVFGTPKNFYLWGFFLAVAGLPLLFIQEPKRRETAAPKVTEGMKNTGQSLLVESGFLLGYAGVTIISTMNLLAGSLLLTYLPPWAKEFGISDFYIGIVIFGLLGSMTMLAFLLGFLSDKYGRRKVIVGGSFVMVLGFLLYSIHTGYLHMLLSTILIGIGSATLAPAVNAYIREISHPSRLGVSFGIVSSISAGGTVAGVLAFGFIVDILGFRDTTFIFTMLILAMTLTSLLIKETTKAGSIHDDSQAQT